MNLDSYKKYIKNEIDSFEAKIPSNRGSVKGLEQKMTKFLEILPEVEKHFDTVCTKYFEGQTLNVDERAELKAINSKVYQDFINRAQIPGLSKEI